MTTMTVDPAPGQSIVLEDVSWDDYTRILYETEAAGLHTRITYDDGRMELMTTGDLHELVKSTMGRLLEVYALEMDIAIIPKGSLTCRRKALRKGLEPDECYYVNTQMPPVSRGELDLNRYPPPDFAIEVDISRSSIPREPIYAALGIREVWRYDGQRVIVLHRGDDGKYARATASIAFPMLPIEIFEHHLNMALGQGHAQAIRAFRDWAREQHQKNGTADERK